LLQARIGWERCVSLTLQTLASTLAVEMPGWRNG